jgi:hypothetical protein
VLQLLLVMPPVLNEALFADIVEDRLGALQLPSFHTLKPFLSLGRQLRSDIIYGQSLLDVHFIATHHALLPEPRFAARPFCSTAWSDTGRGSPGTTWIGVFLSSPLSRPSGRLIPSIASGSRLMLRIGPAGSPFTSKGSPKS